MDVCSVKSFPKETFAEKATAVYITPPHHTTPSRHYVNTYTGPVGHVTYVRIEKKGGSDRDLSVGSVLTS